MSRVFVRRNAVGRLNKRIQIWHEHPDGTDELISNAAAEIQFLSGREEFHSEQLNVNMTHVIRIRFNRNITRSHVVKYMDRRFDIQFTVNVGEENRFMDLYCNEEIL